MPAELTEFVSPSQVPRALKVYPSTVCRWIHHQKIPAIRIGKTVRIRRQDYEAWLKDRARSTAL